MKTTTVEIEKLKHLFYLFSMRKYLIKIFIGLSWTSLRCLPACLFFASRFDTFTRSPLLLLLHQPDIRSAIMKQIEIHLKYTKKISLLQLFRLFRGINELNNKPLKCYTKLKAKQIFILVNSLTIFSDLIRYVHAIGRSFLRKITRKVVTRKLSGEKHHVIWVGMVRRLSHIKF